MANLIEKQPEFINVSVKTIESVFSGLRAQLKHLVELGGGSAGLFADALKITEDALEAPLGIGTALAVIKDVLGIVTEAIAKEREEETAAKAAKDAPADPTPAAAPASDAPAENDAAPDAAPAK